MTDLGEALPSPEHREPTSDEIQAVVDTIDILISTADELPYDEATLPRTMQELAQSMVEGNVAIAGLYPADVPQIPLIPVDDLSELAVKRFPREQAAYARGFRPTLAMVTRRKPMLELGLDAERYEVFHIQEGKMGLHMHVEGVTHTDTDPDRNARDELVGVVTGLQLGLGRVTAHDCLELVRQLSSSAVM